MAVVQEPVDGRALATGRVAGGKADVARCRRRLAQAVGALGGSDGAVFKLGTSGDLELMAAHADERLWEAGSAWCDVALKVTSDRRMVGPVRRAVPEWSRPAQGPYFLGVPLELDGANCGVMVVIGLPSRDTSADVARLGDLPETMALAIEHHRILSALNKRGDDVRTLRLQLDAYARDFRSTYQAERDRAQQLAKALAELESTYQATVSGLAMAVEAKDEYTGGHLYRVSRYGMLLTSVVAPERAEDPQFSYGFLLHDIGKLTVPDAVLNKPGPLSPEEWVVMKTHPERGRSILEGIEFLGGAREIVYCHHERWDGQGYPRGLEGMEIPLGARIFPICDAFDAMTTNRAYRTAMPLADAMAEVRKGSGTQFWPDAVEAFTSIPEDTLYPISRERVQRS